MASKEEDTMGVSRSGRVRKKSSKLMDFESPEEAETNVRSAKKGVNALKAKGTKPAANSLTVPPLQIKIPKKAVETSFDNEDGFSSGEEEDYMGRNDMSDGSELDDEQSEGEVDVAGPTNCDPPLSLAGPKQPSLYLMENAKKKVVLKDGKLVAASRQKAQRKDKGKARFTAYSMWSKEMRPAITRQNPDLKFDAITKRLSELWATVSQAERMTWKRRAMKQATKATGGMISTGVKLGTQPTGVTRPKTAVSPKAKTPGRARPSPGSPAGKRQQPHQRRQSSDGFDSAGDYDTGRGLMTSPPPPPGPIQPRAHELEPLDVASHLHLLGESLSLIGTRLKERDGQIAVSGSLSVLLDSVLCALGPLLCLTRLNPETDGCPPETLRRILDNIAYIMPGLG